MADPRTKLDILYQDVLGDVAALVERVEALALKLDTLNKSTAQIPATLNAAGAAAGSKLRSEIDKATTAAADQLQCVVREAVAAARVVDHAARRFAWLALLTGILGGVIGGLAAIALGRLLDH